MIEENQEFNQEYLPPVKKPFIIVLTKRSFLKIIIFTLIIILLIFFIKLFSSQQQNPVIIQPTPEPEVYFPRPTSSIQLQPSFLATDSAVLKTKAEIESNINTANSLDLSETNLSFPILDFEIGFQ